MAYADALLATGERILLRERQHWFVLVASARWALLALVLGFVLLVLGRAAGALPGGFLGDLFLWATVALLVGGAGWALWAVLRWQNTEYVVTTRRIIACQGVINRRATDSSLEKINDAILSQPLVGRLFGFGDLEVLTASEAGIEQLRMLVDAPGFKRAMLDAKYSLERELTQQVVSTPATGPAPAPATSSAAASAAPAPVAGPAGSSRMGEPPAPLPAMGSDEVTETLARLADLRDRGALTPEEFEAKKRDLLARL